MARVDTVTVLIAHVCFL